MLCFKIMHYKYLHMLFIFVALLLNKKLFELKFVCLSAFNLKDMLLSVLDSHLL